METFEIYKLNQQVLTSINRHEAHDQHIIQQITSDTTQFDLFHLVMKHARKCVNETCLAKQSSPVIYDMLQTEFNAIQPRRVTHSLLVCLIDALKDPPHWDNQLVKLLQLSTDCWLTDNISINRKALELTQHILLRCQLLKSTETKAEILKIVMASLINALGKAEKYITKQDIAKMRSEQYTDFFYQPLATKDAPSIDRDWIRRIVQLDLTALELCAKLSVDLSHDVVFLDLLAFTDYMLKKISSTELKPALFDICCANDDDTVSLMSTVFSIFDIPPQQLVHDSQKQPAQTLLKHQLTPHSLFLFFLYKCGNTHDILIDLLLEDDSNFLEFFTRYVRYAVDDIDTLKGCLDENLDLDDLQSMIAKTVLTMEGDGFPYQARPLIHRLNELEKRLCEEQEEYEEAVVGSTTTLDMELNTRIETHNSNTKKRVNGEKDIHNANKQTKKNPKEEK